MSRKFLILQLRSNDVVAESEYRAMLKYGGLNQHEVTRLRIEQSGMPNLQLDDYCGILVGGSPFDITTPVAQKSPLQLRIESDFYRLFERIVPADKPFLGACSGNGLLGSYLGCRMSRRYAEMVGAINVELTELGKMDPLLQGMPTTIRVLVGHKEACDEVPDKAQLLISGEACPVQMFRVGEHVYATQFHPEGDVDGFCLRIEAYRHNGYFESAEATSIAARLQGESTPYAQLVLRRFVERYRDV